MNEAALMRWVVAAAITLAAIVVTKRYWPRLRIVWPHDQVISERARDVVRWGWRDREVRRRGGITLGIMLLCHALLLIPLPFQTELAPSGVDLGAEFLTPLLPVFALGLRPFLAACGTLLFLSLFIPPLRRWMYRPEGRGPLTYTTIGLTIAIAMGSAYATAQMLEFGGFITAGDWLSRGMVIGSQSAAVMVLLLAADGINRYGLGNGIALLFGTPLLVQTIRRMIRAWDTAALSTVLVDLTAGLLIVALIGFAGRWCRRLAVADAERGPTLYYRITMLGLFPMDAARSLLLLPATLLFFTDSSVQFDKWIVMLTTGWRHQLALLPTLGVMVWLYLFLVCRPTEIHAQMVRHGHPASGESTLLQRLRHDIRRTAVLMTPLFLVILFLPLTVTTLLQLPITPAWHFWIATLPLFVGIGHEITAQLRFHYRRAHSDIADWTPLCTVGDEWEATLIVARLERQQVPALIRPCRAVWLLPIRTMADHCTVYVPTAQSENGRALLA